MPDYFRSSRRVAFHETDAAGIVHFASFFIWMEQAEHALLRSLGYGVFMEWEAMRVSWPRVSARCDYQRPLRFDDEIEIAVSVVHIGTSSVQYRCDFSLQGEPVGVGHTTAVFCRIDPSPIAVPLPDAIRQSLARYLQPQLKTK